MNVFNKAINKNKSNLNEENIFVFGIKPKSPTSDYGYFLTKNIKGNINKVTRFIEKPKKQKQKKSFEKMDIGTLECFIFEKIQSSITLKNITQLYIEIV